MNEPSIPDIKDAVLAFFGKIVTGQSHEVTNVLTIINEMVGLQQDLIGAGPGAGSGEMKRLNEVNRKIRRQIVRGEEILRNMNRFAHYVDSPVAVFEVKENLERMVFLAERWTRLRKAKLFTRFPEANSVIEASPIFFAQAVFTAIDAAIPSTGVAQSITVGYTAEVDGVGITIECAEPVHPDPEVEGKIGTLRGLLEELDGRLRSLPWEGEGSRIEFFIRNRRNDFPAEAR